MRRTAGVPGNVAVLTLNGRFWVGPDTAVLVIAAEVESVLVVPPEWIFAMAPCTHAWTPV